MIGTHYVGRYYGQRMGVRLDAPYGYDSNKEGERCGSCCRAM